MTELKDVGAEIYRFRLRLVAAGVVVVLAFAVVFSDPPRILLLMFLAYAASGPVQYVLRLRNRQSKRSQ